MIKSNLKIYLFLFQITGLFNIIKAKDIVNPAKYLSSDTLVYFEINPAKTSISHMKNLFFSMMPTQKASAEWETFGEIFIEEFGLNLLSPEQLTANGFSLELPTGIAVNYEPVIINEKKFYQRKIAWIFPSENPDQTYLFFKNHLEKQSENNNINYIEIQKNIYLKFTRNQTNFYIYRIENYFFYTNDEKFIRNIKLSDTKNLSGSNNFINFRNFYFHNKISENSIFYFFINSEYSNSTFRENPRLLFDNVFMDNLFIKELAHHSNYIGGSFQSTNKDFRISIKYFFPDNYLDDKNTILGDFLDYKPGVVFTDKIIPLPFAYARWQSNFSGKITSNKENISKTDKNIEKIFRNLFDDNTLEIPENLQYLIKDNISLYIEEIPRFNMINKYYLWKGYLTFTINDNRLDTFSDFMKSLSDQAKDKNLEIVMDEKSYSGKKTWQIYVKKSIKKYDKQNDKVVEELKIYPFYILQENDLITITHDLNILNRKPSQDIKTIIKKTDDFNNKEESIIFAYLDVVKILKYFKESSIALSFINYLSYFENGKYAFFKVTRQNNTITKEFTLKFDR